MQQKDLVDYYNKNTRKFLFFQKDKAHDNIHQALWAKEQFNHNEAINYSNKLIAQQVYEYSTKTKEQQLCILDLGCGVGSTVFYLAQHITLPSKYYGVSISPIQVEIATKKALINTLNTNCQFINSDFHHLPETIPNIDIAYSIEAFIHSKDPSKYLHEVARKLKSRGRLIIIDDFLSDRFNQASPSKKKQKQIDNFKYGWVLGHLSTSLQISTSAKNIGLYLVSENDLTPFLKHRLRDKIIQLLMHFVPNKTKNDYLKSLIGGNARQLCIQDKLVQYKILVFEKH